MESLNINIKKIHADAEVPSYAKDGDAGLDLTATSINITPDYIEYGTGLTFEIPYGYVGLLFPRSSNSKKDLLLCNSVGVVDSSYRGEVKLRFKSTTNHFGNIFEVGDRVAQLVVMPYPQVTLNVVENLTESNRGVDGFGSTGA